MEIIIANKIRLKGPPENLRDFIVEELRTTNPKYTEAINQGFQAISIPPFISNFEILSDESILLPRGYKKRIFELIKQFGAPLNNIRDLRTKLPSNYNIDSSQIKLRPYQVEAIVNLISRGEEGVLVAPAGSGKTVMGISLIPMLGQKMLWLTHTRPLLDQAVDRALSFLPSLTAQDIGVIGDGKWQVGNILTVATVQTLVRRPVEAHKLRDEFGIIILDEAHHAPAVTFLQVIGTFNPYYLYGLTATDERRDKLESLMFQTIGPAETRISIEKVREYGGIIVPTVVAKKLNTKELNNELPFSSLLKELVYDKERNHIIVEDVLREASKGHKCILVTDRKIHAEILFKLLSKRWYKTGIATGNYTKKTIKEQIRRLEEEETTVLIATASLLGEGFDYAPLNRCFLGLPFRNQTKIEQILGRIQRPAEGKNDAVLYDYIDNHSLLQHQFRNRGNKGCRYNIYEKLGVNVEFV